MTDSITVTMTETTTYERTYTVAELAELLEVEPSRAAVMNALDTSNADLGTANESDALLNDVLDHYHRSEDREWLAC